jgi:Ricin-type beta-trefoil lectin domain-like
MKSNNPNHPKLAPVMAVLLLGAGVAQAQLGSGWTQQNYSERLEYHHTGGPTIETISPAPSSFSDSWVSYNNSGGVRTFTFKNTDAGRVEIRVNNDYTSGRHQMEGYLTWFQPSSQLSDYTQTTVMQDFGAATHAAWKLTTHTNGNLQAEGGHVLATGIYGVTMRYNFIHNMDNLTIQCYINGSKKLDVTDEGGSSHYTKYGMYQGHAVVHDTWANVKHFTGGTAPSGGGGVTLDQTGIYQLQNEASGLVLNNQGSLTNGSKVTQWSSSSTSDNLRWHFVATDSGYYQIVSQKSGLDAVVQSASTSSGAGIIQWSFGSAGNDQWLPTSNSDGSITFVNRHSGLVLEDPGSSTSTSTQMDQWTANGGSNQKWVLIKQ